MTTKMFIKGRVYELDNMVEELTLNEDNEVQDYTELGSCGGVTMSYAPYSKRYTLEFKFKYTCCNKWLYKFLDKKFTKNKSFPIVILIGDDTEFACVATIDRQEFGLDREVVYYMVLDNKPEIRSLINWKDVYDGGL